MHSHKCTREKILQNCLFAILFIYIILLLRITLFKQVSLYNLFSAIGAGERAVNIIPFHSVVEMIQNHVSPGRILENVFGNILLFVPLGLILPAVRKKMKSIICAALLLSGSIEAVQFIFALGSTDIDDLIFNLLGALAGQFLCIAIKKRAGTRISFLTALNVVLIVSGIAVFAYLLVNQTDLFTASRHETVVENEELVSGFIENKSDYSGKFIAVRDSKLVIEKSVRNSLEDRTNLEFDLTPESDIYVCYDEIDYFFSAIAGEHKRYEQVTYDEFLAQRSKTFDKENNVLIWSSDKKQIDHLVITEWVE